MNPNINITQAAQHVHSSWPFVKSLLISIGITFAMAVAAYVLIPDTAVMTKQELEEAVVLSDKELLIRKSAVLIIAMSLHSTATKIPGQIATVFKVPGVESKLRATATLLQSAPAFWLSYKTIETRVRGGSPTLNIREIAKDGVPMKTFGGLTVAAGALTGYAANMPV